MKYYFLNDIYSAPRDIPGGSTEDAVTLTRSDCGVIYDIYDRLAEEYPDFVTGRVLGNVFGRDLKSYSIRSPLPENTSDFQVPTFKICIVTSIHGYEQGCAWTAAHFFRLLMEDTADPSLAFLRRNVVFEVIPVANPSGFSGNKRGNDNGVDLNRNFEKDFVYGMDRSSKYWGGDVPCSETETQLLMKFIRENKDAQAVIDYHNIAKGWPLLYVYGEEDASLARSVFTTLTDKWVAEYPELPKNEILGRIKPNGGEGMFADFLLEEKLWPLTLETPWCMPVIGKEKYDATTIRCAVDVLANTLLAIVQSYR